MMHKTCLGGHVSLSRIHTEVRTLMLPLLCATGLLLPALAASAAPTSAATFKTEAPVSVALGEATVSASLVMGKADGPLSQAIAAPPAHGWTSVIVKTDGALTPAQQAQLTALGADITRRLSFIQSLTLSVPSKNLGRLAALPFILHLSSDVGVTKNDAFAVAESGAATAWATPYSVTGQKGHGGHRPEHRPGQ